MHPLPRPVLAPHVSGEVVSSHRPVLWGDHSRRVLDEFGQRLGLQHPNLAWTVLVRLLDPPSWEDDNPAHREVAAGRFPDELPKPVRLGRSLLDRIPVGLPPGHGEPPRSPSGNWPTARSPSRPSFSDRTLTRRRSIRTTNHAVAISAARVRAHGVRERLRHAANHSIRATTHSARIAAYGAIACSSTTVARKSPFGPDSRQRRAQVES